MILLDTQTLFWFLKGDQRLGKRTKQQLEASGELYFSTLSILEFETKAFDRGDLKQRIVRSAAIEAGINELQPKAEAFERVADFPQLRRHDPVDRALLMQASWHNADLYTSDQKLLSLGLAWVKDSQE